MIDFGRSYFTWKSHPWARDPYYKFKGGFVGQYGAVHQVRIQLESACTLIHTETGQRDELFLLTPCLAEYTIVTENLFQVPNGEFRVVFGREHGVPLAYRSTDQPDDLKRYKIAERFADFSLKVRSVNGARTLTTPDEVITATMADELMSGRATYRDENTGVQVILEFPIKLINVQQQEKLFQVCMGWVALPDLTTWDGTSVNRVFLADLAFSGFDYMEFLLLRHVEVAEREKERMDTVRGRDRLELHDPNDKPPGYPPPRPRPMAYHELVRQNVNTVILAASAES